MNDYEKRLDTDHTHEPICPHCGHEVADAWELPDETESVKCEECEKEFSVFRFTEVTYCTFKPDLFHNN